MSKRQLTSKIEELKRGADAMYAEYVAKRDTDKGAADYAWEMYRQLDKEMQKAEEELAAAT